MGKPRVKLAYVLNTYPMPSQSFIRRELQALEAAGHGPVLRLAMRRPAPPPADPGDRAEAARSEYVLDRGALRLGAGLLARLLRHPGRGAVALGLAWRLGRAGRAGPAGRLRHLVYLAEAAAVARRCETAGVAHLHAHFGTNSTAVALLAATLADIGYSFTVHGPEEFDAAAALALPEKLARADFTVAVSSFGRSQLCRWADFDAWPRIKVVPCGIDPAHFADPAPLPPGALRLVSIGRFVEQKGQMVLIEALARLREELPELRLELVGDGPMRGALEEAVARHRLGAMVGFTGWQDEAGVRARIDAAHALVMPSFAEGLPVAIMEAMAAARPVIATHVAGIPELVRPGETGWLVPAGDAAALARAIAELAAAPAERRAEMGRAGRDRALARHDIHRAAAQLAAHFAAAIATRQGPAPPPGAGARTPG